MTVETDPVLEEMFQELSAADPLYRPSLYWQQLNRSHLAALTSPGGFAHFKRTLNESYFQFGFYAFPRALATLSLRWLRHRDLRVVTAGFETPTSARFACLLALGTALYAEAVASLPNGDLLRTLDEPAVGDPIVVRWGTKRTTQDLCHSVEEYLAIRQALRDLPFRRVAEIGAGYGRDAWVWLKTDPTVRYFIVDIPPALYVS